MAKISFPYVPRDVTDPTGKIIGRIMMPYIQIRLSLNRNNPTNFVDALVDSGSDRNLFPKQWGDILGISFKKIKPVKIKGIGGAEIDAYPSKINIWVKLKKYTTEADFSPQQQTPLLGRLGFFNLFKAVIFDERVGCLYLEL